MIHLRVLAEGDQQARLTGELPHEAEAPFQALVLLNRHQDQVERARGRGVRP